MSNTRTQCVLLAGLIATSSNVLASGDAARGQALYQTRCTVCHSIEYSGAGPAHKNLFGRKAGSIPDFPYSSALKASPVVWNDRTLDRWLTDPEKFIPGQRMGISVPDAQDRADLIAYLKNATAR